MSADPLSRSGDSYKPPTFDLECQYDDPIDPSELTIFAPDAPIRTTAWISADDSTAIPLDRCR